MTSLKNNEVNITLENYQCHNNSLAVRKLVEYLAEDRFPDDARLSVNVASGKVYTTTSRVARKILGK